MSSRSSPRVARPMTSTAAVAPVAGVPAARPARRGREAARLAAGRASTSTCAASRATSSPSPRPGAGKTTYALRLAAELLDRRVVERVIVVAPTEHLKTQWAEAAAKVGIPLDPEFSGARGTTSSDYLGIAVTYAGVAANPLLLPASRRGPQDAGDPRRGPPRGRLAVVGRVGARGVRARDPAARPHRHAVPQRHQPDPVRHLRARAPTASRAAPPTTSTATATRCATTSCAR